MTRLPDPNSKTVNIFISARNDEERELIRKFKRVCRKDNHEYMDVFLEVIQRVVRADNPQLHFIPAGDNLVLSKQVARKLDSPFNRMTCGECNGEGCSRCVGSGYVYVEK